MPDARCKKREERATSTYLKYLPLHHTPLPTTPQVPIPKQQQTWLNCFAGLTSGKLTDLFIGACLAGRLQREGRLEVAKMDDHIHTQQQQRCVPRRKEAGARAKGNSVMYLYLLRMYVRRCAISGSLCHTYITCFECTCMLIQRQQCRYV